MWTRVNPECLLFKNFRGKLFENGKRYAKSETTIQKALKERIPNHILHVQFERKTSKFRELWSPARQQIWPWRRSKVTVKVTTWYHRKGLVTRNTHAKYQSSICNSAKVMAKVKVFVTDGQTDRQRDGRMRFNVPTLSRKRGTTSVSQSNLLYPLYVYNYPKQQKMPKRVKMFTSKWHRKQRHFLIYPFTSLQCIWFVGRKFFVENKLTRAYLSGERGGGGGGGVWIFNYSPFWGPFAIWLDQTGTCTTWLWGLQYKTIIGSLWYLATEEMRKQDLHRLE